MTRDWFVKINGHRYLIIFTRKYWGGPNSLFVDGVPVILKRPKFQEFIGTDQPFKIDGKPFRFVLLGGQADIAVDGVFLGSKKPYVPLKSPPWWLWFFVALCVAIPIVSLFSLLPVFIGYLGALFCSRISVNPYKKTLQKILLCFCVAAAAWATFGITFFLIQWIFYII